ncbi:hypothetical protein QN277_017842 [Acacia crassicarpa]|uniref:Serine carboxypeptidase-like 7 n=1 Tax=Acacia crassicarpa TaxID=499986 RepID=A0AAE1JUZ2_9FABA|nr:hypothetical protein QN277_017842 [Acacia crassicarpa]
MMSTITLRIKNGAAAPSTSPSSSSSPLSLLLLLLLSSQACSTCVFSRSAVTFLPGFQGPLPFHLETGYVGVGESEGVQLFYYFLKSDRNPKQDPLMLWLTGGHGCSALSSLLFEIGPLRFRMEEYNGTLPTLVLNPDSWTKISSIIFLDLPALTGFSYTTLPVAPQRSDSKQIQHAVQFLRKWLTDHPEFQSNQIYIGGDSYSGLIVPAVALEISKGNEKSMEPSINLQGCLLGNPSTDDVIDNKYKIPFAHGMGLISDELYESLKSSCGGEYRNVDNMNEACAGYIAEYGKCVSGINYAHILEPECAFASPKPQKFSDRRSLNEMPETLLPSDSQPPLPTITCRTYEGLLAQYWANDGSVRKALGIRQGTIGKWVRCIGIPYTEEIKSSVPFHMNLSAKGYRELIYSGDHDLLVPFRGTEAWIKSLNYSIVDEWRPWLIQGQVAGYTRTYSNGMTFATVKGGGHTAPEYKPKECFAMFERWISQNPL